MSFRTMIVVAGLATLAGGCAVEPRQYDDRGYRYEPRVYRDTDSYQGYFYFRVIYISGTPWYVDEYRRVRPIPPHLHSHFRDASWARSLPPRFGRDREVRDGYDISRIVYINDVPHYVDDDRRARPVPDRVRSRFEYRVIVPQQDADRRGDDRRGDNRQGDNRQGDDRRGDDRPQPSQRYDDREARPVPPAYGREREVSPSQGREQERQENQAYERERERDRQAPPAQVREQPSERGAGRDEGRPTGQDKGRNGDDDQRGARSQSPAETDKARGKGQAVTQPAQPAGDDRKSRTGVAKGDEKRTDTATEKKDEKAKGRGNDRDKKDGDDSEEGKEGDGNARDARRYRSE